ncbi:hypothetical protein C2E15_14465 [Mixta gaviniae]|uniref:Uncharacterized protein n=1 Tax=Mixta gaviniae TaxID=665914 RepID=A0A1X1DW97_9GAMM|nr:hypothetical protein C2E15_14465 [Mixta gaviniae]ORM80889.1 hypothetical protein HA44_10390 [Mixta gaviniae]
MTFSDAKRQKKASQAQCASGGFFYAPFPARRRLFYSSWLLGCSEKQQPLRYGDVVRSKRRTVFVLFKK